MHVLDASRAVVVVGSLLDKGNKEEYIEDVRKEYTELRANYIAAQKSKSFASLAKARSKRRVCKDWSVVDIQKPTFLGTQVFEDYDIKKVVPYIDWDPFF